MKLYYFSFEQVWVDGEVVVLAPDTETALSMAREQLILDKRADEDVDSLKLFMVKDLATPSVITYYNPL